MAKIVLEPVAPLEAIAALEARGAKFASSFDWRDHWQEAHATAFTVAKSTGFDILGDIYGAVHDALAQGDSFENFKEKLTPLLQKKGWWGRQLARDPATGEMKMVQLGSPRRLQIIFDTNLRVSYAAGDWARMQQTKKTLPYLRYVAVMDGLTRPEHAAWHDTVLHIDDPWWQTHYPPNGWNCRCTVQAMSKDDLEDYGLKISDKAPKGQDVPFTNVRTGQALTVPRGIDPGFGYNFGAASLDGNAARLFLEKATPMPPEITAEVMAASARVVVPALSEDFATWVGKVSGSKWKATGEIFPVGALSNKALDFMKLKGNATLSGVLTIQDADLLHMIRDTKRDPLAIDLISALPFYLANPRAILWEKRSGDLLYVLDLGDRQARSGKIVVQVGFIDKGRLPDGRRAKVVTNAIRSGRVFQPRDYSPADYEVIEGELK